MASARVSFPGIDRPITADVDALAARLCGAATRRVAIATRRGDLRGAVVTYLATLRAGLTPAMLRPSWTPDAAYLAEHGFATFVDDGDVASIADVRAADDEDLIVFTSGTTSRPKGVRFTHAAVRANVDATESFLGVTEHDRIALPLPIHYTYGLSTLHLALRVGAAVTFVDYGQPPIAWLGEVMRSDPTVLALLPHQIRLLMRSAELCQERMPALRTITVAGGGIDPALSRELAGRFPEARLFLMYGQTEAGPRASYLPPTELATRAGSIGRGIPGHTELRLAPHGDVAELQVASPSLMLGYLDAEDPSPIADGWLATGDLARVDVDGFVTLVGRAAPFFKPNDERVSFAEILEAAAELLPSATFRLRTVAHPVRGEAIELTAVVDDPSTVHEQEHLRTLQRRLGTAHAPVAIHVVARTDGRKLE